MQFKNREEAGRHLAEKLESYRQAHDAIVVALPRGGVVSGRVVADALGLPLDIVVPRKIGAPEDEEYAIGAIAENGEVVWNETERVRVTPEYVTRLMIAQGQEIARRLKKYRAGLADRVLSGKTVIIVDDGVATGLTMKAALLTVKAEGAGRMVIAVPFAPPEFVAEARRLADEIVTVFDMPMFAGSVGSYYDEFPQVSDEQVMELLARKQ